MPQVSMKCLTEEEEKKIDHSESDMKHNVCNDHNLAIRIIIDVTLCEYAAVCNIIFVFQNHIFFSSMWNMLRYKVLIEIIIATKQNFYCEVLRLLLKSTFLPPWKE